jgi:hypothetical protein
MTFAIRTGLMVGVCGSNKLLLYVISTEIFMVQACVDQSHRRKAYCSTAVDQSYRRKAYCSAVPQHTICRAASHRLRGTRDSKSLFRARSNPSPNEREELLSFSSFSPSFFTVFYLSSFLFLVLRGLSFFISLPFASGVL